MAVSKAKFSVVFNALMILVFAVWTILNFVNRQYGWAIIAMCAFGAAIYATYDASRTLKEENVAQAKPDAKGESKQ